MGRQLHWDSGSDSGTEGAASLFEYFSPCYILWAVMLCYSWFINHRMRALANALHDPEAVRRLKPRWQDMKKGTFVIFVFCTVSHFASAIWMGALWIFIGLPPCIFLGVVCPSIGCYFGDKIIENRVQDLANWLMRVEVHTITGASDRSPWAVFRCSLGHSQILCARACRHEQAG